MLLLGNWRSFSMHFNIFQPQSPKLAKIGDRTFFGLTGVHGVQKINNRGCLGAFSAYFNRILPANAYKNATRIESGVLVFKYIEKID